MESRRQAWAAQPDGVIFADWAFREKLGKAGFTLTFFWDAPVGRGAGAGFSGSGA